jgi:hypothetical protein
MQAPTAPSGPPTQDPDERACPSCGATNGRIAAFCWQCYRPFGAAAPAAASPTAPIAGPRSVAYEGPRYPGPQGYGQAGGLQGAVYAPQPLTTPYAQPKRSLGTMALVVVLSLAAVAGVYLLMHRGTTVELPESFGGLTQIHNPQVESALELFRSQAEGESISADMGIYGQAGTPSVALAWVADAGVPNADAAFTEFAGGFNDGLATGSLDTSRRTTETIDGVQYLCAPVSGAPASNVCMWQKDGIYWVLFDLSGQSMNATQDLAVAAYGAPTS